MCCLQVFHSKKIPFLGTCIGTFKMDVETVYSQPGMRDCIAYLYLTLALSETGISFML